VEVTWVNRSLIPAGADDVAVGSDTPATCCDVNTERLLRFETRSAHRHERTELKLELLRRAPT